MREAVVFAAGLGTRLRPLTEKRPKALVAVRGVPMLERVARRLVDAGIERLVVNVHAFADQIEAFVVAQKGFGVEVAFSRETERPLETGGGLRHAGPLLKGAGPVLVHNVDVLSDLDLGALLAAHEASGALATLATRRRPSARQLLFDDEGLVGRIDRGRDLEVRVRAPRGEVRELAFSGIHAFSRPLLARIEERGAFSVVDLWLRLAAAGARIRPYEHTDGGWIDIGRPADLARAEACDGLR